MADALGVPPTLADPVVFDAAEREYRRHAPHLWPWAGWHAVIVGDRFAGVFPTRDAALLAAATAVGRADVLVRRIGPRSAVPVPAADGGPHRR